jgi:putative exosortase-associated protein (TIGR04073 family)
VVFGWTFAGTATASGPYEVESGFLLNTEFIGGHVLGTYEKHAGPFPSPFFEAYKKLGRGTVNLVSSPIELLKQPLVEMDKAESVFEFVGNGLHGFLIGIAWFPYRAADGFYEVTTFYLPNLQPIIDPAYIF